MMNSKHYNALIAYRHILLLPLLFLLAILYPWQVREHSHYNDYNTIGAVAGGASGGATALQGERYNRQLHQQEIKWLKDKKNIESFIAYYQEYTGESISLEEAGKILAQGGASLVDKSWNDKVGSDSRVKEAQDFIKETYTDKSAIFYNDKNGMRVGTKAFDVKKDSDEYKDRYANMEGFTKNKDFYKENLNFNTGKAGSASDCAKGAIQPLKELGNALIDHTGDTLKAMGEGALHPIDSGIQAGEHIASEEEKAQLDSMLGDDASAAQHRGNAYGGIAAAVVTKGAIKGIGGKVRVTLEGGKTVDVPEGAVVKGSDGKLKVDQRYLERDGKVSHNSQLHEKINKNSEIDQVRRDAKVNDWKKEDGSDYWPDNTKGYDAVPGTQKTTELQPGETVTRYVRNKGQDYEPEIDAGKYISKDDVPFDKRSLPGNESEYTKQTFEVQKPIPGTESKATRWFDKKGNGNQVELEESVGVHVNEGNLKHTGGE